MPQLRFVTLLNTAICAVLLALAPFATADSWSYPAERREKVFTFGETKIVMVTDGTLNRQSPDFTMQVFKNDELQSQVRNVSFEHVSAAPDGKLFVGLSNRGIPGSAVMVFNDRGAISLFAVHGIAEFDYCETSMTVARKWFDAANPQVSFQAGIETRGTSGITLRDCRGKVVDLADVVLTAYHASFVKMQKQRGFK
jgi:hypothetical protein